MCFKAAIKVVAKTFEFPIDLDTTFEPGKPASGPP